VIGTVLASLLNSTSINPSLKKIIFRIVIFIWLLYFLLVAYQALSGALVLFVSMVVFEFAPELIGMDSPNINISKMEYLKKGADVFEPCGSEPYRNKPDFKLTTENGGTIEGFKSGENHRVKFCPKEGDIKNFASYAGFSEHTGTMADLLSKLNRCGCANLSNLNKD
jgi:hypothetical protein